MNYSQLVLKPKCPFKIKSIHRNGGYVTIYYEWGDIEYSREYLYTKPYDRDFFDTVASDIKDSIECSIELSKILEGILDDYRTRT